MRPGRSAPMPSSSSLDSPAPPSSSSLSLAAASSRAASASSSASVASAIACASRARCFRCCVCVRVLWLSVSAQGDEGLHRPTLQTLPICFHRQAWSGLVPPFEHGRAAQHCARGLEYGSCGGVGFSDTRLPLCSGCGGSPSPSHSCTYCITRTANWSFLYSLRARQPFTTFCITCSAFSLCRTSGVSGDDCRRSVFLIMLTFGSSLPSEHP